MRVVIKPAGVVVSLVVLGVMLFVILTYLAKPIESSGTSPAITTAAPAGSIYLGNSNFEGEYLPYQYPPGVKPETAKAKVTGSIAQGWFDNSDWANVVLEYAPDATKPHEGSKSQRLTVKEIRAGGGQLQFAQRVQLSRDRNYTFSLYARAEKSVSISIAIRAESGGEPYATTDATLGPEWKRIEATGTVTGDTGIFLMVFVREPATIWVDDANLLDNTAASTPTTPIVK